MYQKIQYTNLGKEINIMDQGKIIKIHPGNGEINILTDSIENFDKFFEKHNIQSNIKKYKKEIKNDKDFQDKEQIIDKINTKNIKNNLLTKIKNFFKF